MKMFNYSFDKVAGEWRPGQYPSNSKADDWTLPDEIRTDHAKLNNIIETKYTREFLKVCAFYNKMFPSLKSSNWTRTFYNVPPFTVMDQERSDTGTGISSNYLKQIIDQVTARLGTVQFDATILTDVPTLEYILYKDEAERLLRKMSRNNELNRMTLEMFHDASILGYSHAFIDPFTHNWVKASDWEVGFYEAQFNRGPVRQMLYRDYAFPTTELTSYLAYASEETREKIVDDVGNNATVDFKMYFDCPQHKVHVTINGTTIEDFAYPFDKVQMVTFSWDTGFTKVMSTSLFDLLYPVQRELNKVNAKLQQMIRMYKGAVPIFNTDADIAMKSISNGTGEALYIDSARSATDLMTVINPTPLDAQLDAQKTSYKTEMMELAGIQQVSFDMENMRSAAAVIALDQTRDTVFQAQMFAHATVKADMFLVQVYYNSIVNSDYDKTVDWGAIYKLSQDGVIELKPTHSNDPLGLAGGGDKGVPPPDFQKILAARTVIGVLKGDVTFDNIPLTIDKEIVKALVAATVVKLAALLVDIPAEAEQFLMQAFIYDIKNGVVDIGQLAGPPQAPSESGPQSSELPQLDVEPGTPGTITLPEV